MLHAPMGSHSLLSNIRARFSPELDPEFIPISLVLKKTHECIAHGTPSVELTFSLERLPGDRSIHSGTARWRPDGRFSLQ